MNDELKSMMLIALIALTFFIFGGIVATDIDARDKLIACEKDLPRSQSCTLIAVPK